MGALSLPIPRHPGSPAGLSALPPPVSLLFLVLPLEQMPMGRREGRAARGPLWTNPRDLGAEMLVLVA